MVSIPSSLQLMSPIFPELASQSLGEGNMAVKQTYGLEYDGETPDLRVAHHVVKILSFEDHLSVIVVLLPAFFIR